ncbi:MAG: S-layer homology domain-containing protein [Oscillospiraceae bacterium]|nr:S-layer homology domain-containing protein [Oscillospiraceae bacterium]
MKKRLIAKLLVCLLILPLLIPPTSAYAAPANITARSAIVIDFETGDVLWGRDIDTLRTPASMTKVMTAYIIYEEIAAGRLNFDTMISVSQNAERISRQFDWGGRYVRAGQRHSVETMLRLIMLPSHNGACVAMAEHISGSETAFAALMNETAQRLGMNARYDNSHGATGSQLTARSMATLVREFITTHPDILRITRMTSFTFAGGYTPNTNLLLPGRTFATQGADGFKTGTTTAAGHCLSATALRDGRRVITVVMNAPDNNGRYGDTRALFNFGFSELARRDGLMNAITVDVTANVPAARRNTDIDFMAQLNNVDTGNIGALGGGWTVNGQTVSTFGTFLPTDQPTFSISHFLPADSDLYALDVGFFIDLPGGIRRNGSITLPVSDEPPALFRDISGHWAEDQIGQAVEQGLFTGNPDGSFAPNGEMTRAMFVTVLGRLAASLEIDTSNSGDTPFLDVSPDTWYGNYVAWAWEQEIVQGVSADWFGAEQATTRQEAATFLYRFMQRYDIELPGEMLMDFPDADLIDTWAYDAMTEAVRTGLIRGTGDGYLAPTAEALRAEVAVIFLRFIDAYTALD